MDFARSWAGQRSMHLVDMFSFSKAMSRLGLAGSESGIGWKSGECERPGGQMLSAFLNTRGSAGMPPVNQSPHMFHNFSLSQFLDTNFTHFRAPTPVLD